MSFKPTFPVARLAATALALLLPTIASAHMVIEDAYARAASPMAQTGAAFMSIFNHSDMDDRVLSVTSDVAERVELHTHVEEAGGVMRMVEIEGGIAIPAGETHLLQRGGDHVMFLGLTRPLVEGEEVELTITFEHAEPVTVVVPVDLERQDMPGGGMMNHDAMDHDMDHGSDG